MICGPDKVPSPAFRVMELLDQADKDTNRVHIARGFPPGAYGLDAAATHWYDAEAGE